MWVLCARQFMRCMRCSGCASHFWHSITQHSERLVSLVRKRVPDCRTKNRNPPTQSEGTQPSPTLVCFGRPHSLQPRSSNGQTTTTRHHRFPEIPRNRDATENAILRHNLTFLMPLGGFQIPNEFLYSINTENRLRF